MHSKSTIFPSIRVFLCGRRLSQKTRSNEHVFPQWLLRRFDLYDKQLNLLNGHPFPIAS
jgi:hypothetical protein